MCVVFSFFFFEVEPRLSLSYFDKTTINSIRFVIFGFCLLCSLYDQIFKPSKLPANADFHLFKSGVEPKWEDPECANGGKWSVTSSRKANLDSMWMETV